MNRLSELDTSLTPAYQNNYMQLGATQSAKTGTRKEFSANQCKSLTAIQQGGEFWGYGFMGRVRLDIKKNIVSEGVMRVSGTGCAEKQ